MREKIQLLDEVECPTLAEIICWMEAKGWVRDPTLVSDVWGRWTRDTNLVEVPLREEFRDWKRRVIDVVQELSLAEGLVPAKTAREMTKASSQAGVKKGKSRIAEFAD